MIIEAVLISVAKLVSKRKQNHAVAIFPDMRLDNRTLVHGKLVNGRLDEGKGIVVSHHLLGYEVRLTGTVDYGVIQYPLELDNKELYIGRYNCRDLVLTLATSQLFLIHAKYQGDEISSFIHHIPEVVSQAAAFCEVTKQDTVHFCVSNGTTWVFYILMKAANGERVYYKSSSRQLFREYVQSENERVSLPPVQEILELVYEWLEPTDCNPPPELYDLCQ